MTDAHSSAITLRRSFIVAVTSSPLGGHS